MTKAFKRAVAVSAATVMLITALASCGKQTQPINTSNPTVEILCKAFNATSADNTSPVLQEVEKYLAGELGVDNVTMNIKWAPNATYAEKVVTTMGSGIYPHAMLVSERNSSVIVAARKGVFWDITDAFDENSPYENLKQSDKRVNKNISIDGRNFGIYRTRELGRAGVSIRKDWLDRLGESIPETLEDLDRVMRRFSTEDPDGNGVDGDTYGMIVTTYIDGPLENLAIWNGAPNGWGLNESTGQLEPSFMFPEYMEAMDLLKKWYDSGYINSNMSSMPSDKWDEQFLNGEAGIIIDVADRARRLAQNIAKVDVKEHPKAAGADVDVFGYVKKDAASEPRTLPTKGYDSFYVIPKTSVTDEEQLDFMLQLMDHLNDEKAVDLMNNGIEGRHYTIDEEGYLNKIAFKAKDSDPDDVKAEMKAKQEEQDKKNAELNDLNQLSMGIVSYPDGIKTRYSVPVAAKIEKVYEDNRNWTVSNPAEPYVSPTNVRRGVNLTEILTNAKIQYITGTITKEEYLKQIERWKSMGGSNVIEEINESYRQDTSIEK